MGKSRFSGPIVSAAGFMVDDTLVIDENGTVAADSMSESVLQTATVNITNSQLKNLRATPKTLVNAPGAGKMLQFIDAVLINNGGNNAITESDDNLAVRYENGSGVIVSQAIEATGFVTATAATRTSALAKIDAIVASSNAINKALVLHNTGDGEYAGNAANDVTLTVLVHYRVLTI